jgi:hypothetical protein
LKRRIEVEVPVTGDFSGTFGLLNLRDAALENISRLDPVMKVDWNSDSWVAIESSTPSPRDYEKNLATMLQGIGCSAKGAPHVVRGLLPGLERRFAVEPSRAVALAAAFLDEANCPGVHGLSELDKSELQTIRDRYRPPRPRHHITLAEDPDSRLFSSRLFSCPRHVPPPP